MTVETTPRDPRGGAFSKALEKLETGLVVLSGVSIGAIMLIVVLDVIMRYAVASPLGWPYDVIGHYLMVAVFFLALSDTLHHHGHIALDIFSHRIPHQPRHLLLGLGFGAATVVMALIAWQAAIRLQDAYAGGDFISMTVPTPTWPTYAIVVVGSTLMTLRCLGRTVGHVASLVTGRDLADTPPPPETSTNAGEHAE